MAWAIKDPLTEEYYCHRPQSTGWYSKNIEKARVYGSAQEANIVIDAAGHHVRYPNRSLIVVGVELKETLTIGLEQCLFRDPSKEGPVPEHVAAFKNKFGRFYFSLFFPNMLDKVFTVEGVRWHITHFAHHRMREMVIKKGPPKAEEVVYRGPDAETPKGPLEAICDRAVYREKKPRRSRQSYK